MKETFILLAGQIDFAVRSIPKSCIDISKKNTHNFISDFWGFVGNKLNSKECSEFCEVWKEGINLYLKNGIFTEEDCEIFENVGNMPLYLDKNMQLRVLNETIKQLEESILISSKNLASKIKIYRYTGVSAGIFIVLILI